MWEQEAWVGRSLGLMGHLCSKYGKPIFSNKLVKLSPEDQLQTAVKKFLHSFKCGLEVPQSSISPQFLWPLNILIACVPALYMTTFSHFRAETANMPAATEARNKYSSALQVPSLTDHQVIYKEKGPQWILLMMFSFKTTYNNYQYIPNINHFNLQLIIWQTKVKCWDGSRKTTLLRLT